MQARDNSIDQQLSDVSRLVEHCHSSRDRINTIREQVRQLSEAELQELAQAEQKNLTELQNRLHQVESAADSDQQTLQADRQTREQTLQSNHDQKIAGLNRSMRDEVGECEEKRRTELWMLQSVLDESSQDSPATAYDRESETFSTQKTFLDERFEMLQTHITAAAAYLKSCHTSDEAESPPPKVGKLKRIDLRDQAVESGDHAITAIADLRSLTLPPWVKGARIWVGAIAGMLTIWITSTAVRADINAFINPDIASPDWEWAGVSAVIALATTLLTSLVLILLTQRSLRQKFENILQHVSNADHARKLWEEKSVEYLERLEKSAEEWREKMEARRVSQARRITSEIDSRILAVESETEDKVRELTADLDRQIASLSTEMENQAILIETRRHQELATARSASRDALTEAQQTAQRRYRGTADALVDEGNQLLTKWQSAIQSLRQLTQQATEAGIASRRWPQHGSDWKLPEAMPESMGLGDILVAVPGAPAALDVVDSTSLCLEMPALLLFPRDAAILVEHDSTGRDAALSFIRTQILKLLTILPAGRIRLTLIDPVGLGQSFAAMMHLADFDELLIQKRIRTDGSQIRDQLQKVTEHMENIFQTYLRSQFETIEEYNASAGEVAEPYHFVVVAGFPTAFTDEAARHLSAILTSGPKCGVHAIVAWNPAVAPPPSFDPEELRQNCVRFRATSDGVLPAHTTPQGVIFEAWPEPPAEQYVALVRDAGEQSKDARRVEVSFNRIAPARNEIWTKSTADGIDLPIGRAGAARLQFMRLGRGTSQHVLIAGKTGSGKSTFLHILITNLALHYSPNEIQFYLIDFKKGVEFKTYAAKHLPHARVVAIESDREFGLSVLERLDEVLQQRGELFRDRGIQDVPAFRKAHPDEAMPRLMLLIDEFQEFFVAEDRVSSRASLLLDRLVRQGRAFGIHVLLGSQTLGGAYSLARSTMGQIAVRIALQCSESDAHLILSEDNTAARLLTRPGEAIYNDANGMAEGNHQFQIAWLDESRREEAMQSMLQQNAATGQVPLSEQRMLVFEGNVPPTAALCGPLNAWLAGGGDATRGPSDGFRLWLGEPVAIAAPTCLELRRASGQNILIVGQDDLLVDSLLAHSLLSCSRQPATKGNPLPARIRLLHSERETDALLRFQELNESLADPGFSLHATDECEELIRELHQLMEDREAGPETGEVPDEILAVRSIGQFRSLRKEEDDFGLGGFGEPKEQTVAGMFGELIKRGPLTGIHVIVWSDTFNNAVRWLSASLLREFENRIAFRMNQTDSASMIDSPVASTLGTGRALLYRDQTGVTEKFRPFAWPSMAWLAGLSQVSQDNPESGADLNPDMDIDLDSWKIE